MQPDGNPPDDLPLAQYATAPVGAAVATPRRRRSRVVAATAFVGLAALVVAVLAMWDRNDERDPAEALARAQEFVQQAQSVQFAFDFDATDLSADVPHYHSSGTGSWTPDAWRIDEHMASDDPDEVDVEDMSFMVVDGVMYTRWVYGDDTGSDDAGGWYDGDDMDTWYAEPYAPPTRAEVLDFYKEYGDLIDDPQSDVEFDPSLDADTFGIVVALSELLGGAGAGSGPGLLTDPRGFLEAIAALGSPSVVAENGEVLTIESHLTVANDALEAFGHPVPDGIAKLDLGADDVPTALRINVASGDASLAFDIRFSAWDEPLTVTAPDPADVSTNDDEDWTDLRADPVTVPEVESLTPVRIGEGAGDWSIDWATLYDDQDCGPSLYLTWTTATEHFGEGDSLEMELTTIDCLDELGVSEQLPDPAPGTVTFVRDEDSGEYAAWVAPSGDTIALVYFDFASSDVSQERQAEIMRAIEVTDWVTLQGEVVPS